MNFWYKKIVPIFWYQKMIFWYQKLISDIRKWFSDIRNSCWFSDIRKSFSDIRKSALKSYLAFHSDGNIDLVLQITSCVLIFGKLIEMIFLFGSSNSFIQYMVWGFWIFFRELYFIHNCMVLISTSCKPSLVIWWIWISPLSPTYSFCVFKY